MRAGIAPFHVAALAQMSDRAEIVWVADPDNVRGQQISHLSGAKLLGDYRQGLDQVDCAFVLVPHHLHHPVTLDCLHAGLHVLLEKPVANTLEQVDELISASKKLGKR